ncbi:probable RNA methyltransferase CG1239 [Drosophila grimshawi]|uniref:RNA methyltransferase n=1 Tax=Drosophila grimshawi TaxID=7222 RepID=B4JUG9_DROGR|nr:probable RNA methyltransferase CG1239 [Drosophila grimshawi]EDV91139.1 GH17289 [Drosophila grimshawi]
MEVENNNNTIVPAVKRSATADVEDGAQNTKRLKHNATDSSGEVHVPEDNSKQEECSQRAPAQSPKKRLQLDSTNVGNTGPDKPRHNKNETFMYGNYRHYYGKRILDKDFHDIRLDVLATQTELFRGKQLLDIGCNSGHLSIEIAKKFGARSLVGLDIDRNLAHSAQMVINALKRSSVTPITPSIFPYNVKFVHGNYVLDDDVLLEIERPQYDVILCLSVTKWIHLNFCDAGLKQAFRRMFLQLRRGGKLILEPQSFDTYKRRKKLSESIRENYNAIKFQPDHFTAYLLSPEVGFASMELMGVPEHCKAGFKRPIQIFSKV